MDDQVLRKELRENYFSETINVSESTRKVLENYSKIPSDEVMPHVYAIREKAFAIFPYPCIGLGRFLDLAIGRHSLYQSEILPRMKTGQETFIDLGCAFAQDIRRLVADGVDSSQCYGSDLRLDFIEIGYELFRDKDSLQSKFIAADIFDPSSPLHAYNGTFDLVGSSAFFHLFPWAEQKQIALRVGELLKPQKDSMVFGIQMGNINPGEAPRRSGNGTRYRHSVESWRKLWEEVGGETGVKYEVKGRESALSEYKGIELLRRLDDPNATVLEFSVRRL